MYLDADAKQTVECPRQTGGVGEVKRKLRGLDTSTESSYLQRSGRAMHTPHSSLLAAVLHNMVDGGSVGSREATIDRQRTSAGEIYRNDRPVVLQYQFRYDP